MFIVEKYILHTFIKTFFTDCPYDCTHDFEPMPVCGTDDVTYPNICSLEATACETRNLFLEVAHQGECRGIKIVFFCIFVNMGLYF